MSSTIGETSGDDLLCRTKLISSSKPKFVFNDFRVTIVSNDINTHNYLSGRSKNLPAGITRISAKDWNSILKDDDAVLAEEKMARNAEGFMIAETSIPDTNTVDDSGYVMVYNRAVSYRDESLVDLPGEVSSANVLKHGSFSEDDILVVSLKGYGIYFIKFLKDDISCTPVVVESYSHEGIMNVQDDLQLAYDIACSSGGTVLILKSNDSFCQILYLSYDDFGVPKVKDAHNISLPGKILSQLLLPINKSDDALISTVMTDDDILMFVCLYNLVDLKRRDIFMKNTFSVPKYSIPLVNTSSVLFLHKDTYTFKSLGFFINNDEVNPQTSSYFDNQSSSVLNSYYIPKSKIPTEALSKNLGKKHDQVVISFSKPNQVIVVDVFYDQVLHRYFAESTFLFKWKYSLDIFYLEYDDNEFFLRYSNNDGIFEEIIFERSSVGEIKHNITPRPYPINSALFVKTLASKSSLEYRPHDLWAVTGRGSNSYLMNIWHGLSYISFRSSQKLYDISSMFSFNTSKGSFVLLSEEKKTSLFAINESNGSIDIEKPFTSFDDNFLPDKILLLHSLRNDTQMIITANELLLLDTIQMKKILRIKFPHNCIIATAYENIVALGYRNDEDQSQVAVFKINTDHSVETIEAVMNEFENKELSCIKLWKCENHNILAISDFEGDIHFFIDFEFAGSTRIYAGQQFVSGIEQVDKSCVVYQMEPMENGNKVVFTTFTGDYSIGRLIIQQSFSKIVFKNADLYKLSDKPVDIIMRSEKEVFLLANYLWLLDPASSNFPERVFLSDRKENIISAAVNVKDNGRIGDTMFTIRDNTVVTMSMNKSKQIFSKPFKLNYECDKLFYFSACDVLIMKIKKEEVRTGKRKLYFFDSKFQTMLKYESSPEPLIFKDQVNPECFVEWRYYMNNKFYSNLVVGCSTQAGGGMIMIFKVTKNANLLSLDLIFCRSEYHPIENIEFLNEHILFSCGSKLFTIEYDSNTKKFKQKVCIYEAFGKIKSFSIRRDPEQNRFCDINVIDSNNSWVDFQYSPGKGINSLTNSGDIVTDSIVLSWEKALCINQIHNQLTLLNVYSKKKNVMDIPANCTIHLVSSFSPWVMFFEREEAICFITLTEDGDMDLIQVVPNYCKNRIEARAKLRNLEYIPNKLESIRRFYESKGIITMDKVSVGDRNIETLFSMITN